jgi:hypothetical protein
MPCEVVPSFILDTIESRNRWLTQALELERDNHDTTLDLLAAAHERAARAEAQRDLYKSMISSVPTWVWWTAIGITAAASCGATLWLTL